MIKNALKSVCRRVLDIRSALLLKRTAKCQVDSGQPTKVAFLFQCPELWDKTAPVFEAMKDDPRFEPTLIALPDPSVYRWGDLPVGQMSRVSEEKCKELYSDSSIVRAVDDEGHLVDLSRQGYHFVFYQRPYDSKLPPSYRSSVVSTWARVCYMPYGLTLAPVFESMHANNSRFMRNASYVFLSSKWMLPVMERNWSHRPGSEWRHFISIGYPSLLGYLKQWNGPQKAKKILWTPRWSTDPKIGGSNFFRYKDDVIELASMGYELTIRPHQLLWANLVDSDLMTDEEIIAYKENAIAKGCSFSEGRECADDFEWSDAIIADYSSITVEYFLSGKPMIFCPPPFELNGLMTELMQGMYIARSWSDIEGRLALLRSGSDPKLKTRQEIIQNEFADLDGSAQKILQVLWDACHKSTDIVNAETTHENAGGELRRGHCNQPRR